MKDKNTNKKISKIDIKAFEYSKKSKGLLEIINNYSKDSKDWAEDRKLLDKVLDCEKALSWVTSNKYNFSKKELKKEKKAILKVIRILNSRRDYKALINKIYSYIYIPLQYMIVRWYMFGFKIQPSLDDLYSGLNIGNIVKTIFEFIGLLPGAFSIKYIYLVIIYFIPYFLELLYQARFLIIYSFVMFQMLCYFLFCISVILYNLSVDMSQIFGIISGAPGTGKSSTAGYFAMVIAKKMWSDVRFKYWLYKPRVKKWERKNNKDKLSEWKEIKEAYEFWRYKPCIKCLVSNVPVKSMYKAQDVIRLTRDHLYQASRIPTFSMLLVDEVSSMVDVTNISMDRPMEVADLCRWSRHFGFSIVATEQDAMRVQKDMRRVSGYNNIMIRQRWVCKPYPLLIVYLLLKVLLPLFPANIISSKILSFFKTLSQTVGFRRYTYRTQGNTEQTTEKLSRKKSLVLPATLNYFYDDRTFRDFYKVINDSISYDIFPSLKMSREHMESFMRKTQGELLQENEENYNLVSEIRNNPAAQKEFEEFLNEDKEINGILSKFKSDKLLKKAREINKKYLNEDVYIAYEFIKKNAQAYKIYQKYKEDKEQEQKKDIDLLRMLANNKDYEAITNAIRMSKKA